MHAAVQGVFGSHLRTYAGWRRDEIEIENQDLLRPPRTRSASGRVSTLPKATVSVVPGPQRLTPQFSASFGRVPTSPRTRASALASAPSVAVSRSHFWQLVAGKSIVRTEFHLTLGRVTTVEQDLAKIDPDTGLRENQGPGRNLFLTAALEQAVFIRVRAADGVEGRCSRPLYRPSHALRRRGRFST